MLFGDGATGISGSCRFAVMLSPKRRAQIWPTFPSCAGLVQHYMGAASLESAVGATWFKKSSSILPDVKGP